jgi:subfamily B ATP-binding cassette protein MsbA
MGRSEDLRALFFLASTIIRPYWRRMVLLVTLSMSAAMLLSLQPLVIAPAMDSALMADIAPARSLSEINLNNLGQTVLSFLGLGGSQNQFKAIVMTAVLYVAIATGIAVFQFSAYLLSAWVVSSIYRDLAVALYSHLISLSISYFVRQRTGDIVSRTTNDASEVIGSIDFSLRQIMQSSIQVLLYGIILFRTVPSLAFATIIVGLLHLLITRGLRDRVRSRTADRFDALSDLSTRLQESLLGIRIIKSFAAETFELDRFKQIAGDVQRRTMKYGVYKHVETPLRGVADALAVGTILLLSFWTLQTGGLTISGFVLFLYVARQTIAPVSQLAQSALRLYEGLGSATRVLAILNSRPEVMDGNQDPKSFSYAINLEQVSFFYHTGQLVLRNLNLEIRKGEVMAIVGHSGAGKSTLADLILRLYDPTSGRVTLDGIDIRQFRQEGYRRLFGVVSQECLLFNATVRENIAYNHPASTQEEIVRAAQIANAEEFIARLPAGYDTVVGDRGIRLSGGQRQRIAIARAICANPQILILDEATSSLDTESERLVQQAIDRVLRNMTAVVIAHRLSTVVNADKIVVLTAGEVEAVDPHQVLLETSQTYRRLYELQFRDEASPAGDGRIDPAYNNTGSIMDPFPRES